MRVGVTGGNGFIGGWVCDELAARGHEAVVFDHHGRGYDAMLGDIRDQTAVVELAAHVDGIIHLAAVLGTQETIENPAPAAETNILGGLNIAAACRQYDLPLVNIAVGNHWMLNAYSISKSCVERFLNMHRIEHGLRVNQVRVVNAYGPRQRAAPPFASGKVRKIMPAFICRALSGMPIAVYGDGSQVSDCVYVSDVARVLVTAFEAAARGNVFDRTVEVGPVAHTSVGEVAGLVRDATAHYTGQKVDVVHLPMRPGEEPGAYVTADTSTFVLVGEDPDRLKPLTEGIAETTAWFAAHEGDTWQRP